MFGEGEAFVGVGFRKVWCVIRGRRWPGLGAAESLVAGEIVTSAAAAKNLSPNAPVCWQLKASSIGVLSDTRNETIERAATIPG